MGERGTVGQEPKPGSVPSLPEGVCAAQPLSDEDIRKFIGFFTMLDRWDREAHGNETM